MLIPYVRRSRNDEEVVSISEQTRLIEEWAARNGVELADPVIEMGVSGARSWRERALGDVIERCKRGEAEGVVVAYFSRLTREKASSSMEVLEELEPLRLAIVRDGRDMAAGDDKTDLLNVILSHQASAERKVMIGNLTLGKHEMWERGGYVIPNLPAGYDQTFVEEDRRGRLVRKPGALRKNEHAEQIARAFQSRATGGSWAEVARALRGVPTRTGETLWSTEGARSLMRNPIYTGTLRCTCGCGKEKFVKELAIVSPSLWKSVQPTRVSLEDRSHVTIGSDGKPKVGGRKDHGKRLLGGLLVCRSCGKGMTHHVVRGGNGSPYRYYVCHATGRCDAPASVPAPAAEEYVKSEALWAFAAGGVEAGSEPDVERLAELEHERDAAKDRLAGLVRIIDPLDPGADERLTEAREEVAAAEAAVLAEKESERAHVSEEEVRAAFERASVEEQRQLIRLALLPMPVTPGRGDVAERIQVAYRRIPQALRAGE